MPETHRIVVLGGGRVGSAIARDLVDSAFEVTVVDHDAQAQDRLVAAIAFQQADLRDPAEVSRIVAGHDLAIGAVPGWLGFQTLRAVIEAERDIVDISFFEEDPFELDELARAKGVTAVVDCGVAPGLSNLVLGHLNARFDRLDRFVCLVGGLPEDPQPPWRYKAPYSPADVIEMYTRPARIRRDGVAVTLPALTEPEMLDFPGVGELESFNTDGLRTLLDTCDVPDLAERTLRYPGHREQIELLATSGFFEREVRQVGESAVRPIDLASDLLFEQWHQGPRDYDMTVMRLIAAGQLEGQTTELIYDLCDRFDRSKGISSMARTTGYPCAAAARLVANKGYQHPGISPPEYLGRDEACYQAVLDDLTDRGVGFEIRS